MAAFFGLFLKKAKAKDGDGNVNSDGSGDTAGWEWAGVGGMTVGLIVGVVVISNPKPETGKSKRLSIFVETSPKYV